MTATDIVPMTGKRIMTTAMYFAEEAEAWARATIERGLLVCNVPESYRESVAYLRMKHFEGSVGATNVRV